VSDLRQDAAKILKQLRENKELLRLLANGDKEVEKGDGYDLDTVLSEADSLLN
jgi:hypothetical protein